MVRKGGTPKFWLPFFGGSPPASGCELCCWRVLPYRIKHGRILARRKVNSIVDPIGRREEDVRPRVQFPVPNLVRLTNLECPIPVNCDGRVVHAHVRGEQPDCDRHPFITGLPPLPVRLVGHRHSLLGPPTFYRISGSGAFEKRFPRLGTGVRQSIFQSRVALLAGGHLLNDVSEYPCFRLPDRINAKNAFIKLSEWPTVLTSRGGPWEKACGP